MSTNTEHDMAWVKVKDTGDGPPAESAGGEAVDKPADSASFEFEFDFSPVNPELRDLDVIASVLERHDREAQVRMIAWVAGRYGKPW